MGQAWSLAGRVEQCMSWWRTLREFDTAARHLDRLALASARLGYQAVKMSPAQSTVLPFPLLLIYARGAEEAPSILATARVVPGGGWAYFDASCDPWFRFAACRDVVAAAARADAILKHQMFPGTFPNVS